MRGLRAPRPHRCTRSPGDRLPDEPRRRCRRRSHRDVSWRRRTRRDQPQGVESHELRAWRGARGGLAARQAGRPVQHARRAERLMSEVCIRAAEPADVPVLLTLIRALAAYEKLDHDVIATEADLRKHLFGVRPYADATIADVKGGADRQRRVTGKEEGGRREPG